MYSVNQQNSLIEHGSTVLIIEDDRMVSTLLKSYLEKFGFVAHQIYSAEKAEELTYQLKPSLVILDIGLPDISGLDVCESLRHSYFGPIMILSANSSDQEQVAGFVAGADDYVTKPVSASLLKVRAEALIRRSTNNKRMFYKRQKQIGNLVLDPNAHRCLINDEVVKLSSFEFRLLNLLMDNQGKVMSRDKIYNELLGRQYNGTERTVDVRMAKLREKLELSDFNDFQIETVWGKGYVLNTAYSLVV